MATCTKTVVFTDLAGYTQRIAKISGAELKVLAKEHEQHTLEIFKPFGGELVKSIGDSYMVVFNSATEAVKACLKLVSSPLPGAKMEFRASVVTGDVQELSNDYFGNKDYFGEAVNLAARINSITPAGEVWFSNRTRVCMNQFEVAWETVGIHSFKGIAEKEECFRAVLDEQCILAPTLSSAVFDNKYIILRKGSKVPPLKGKQVILVDFTLGSEDLKEFLASLPIVPPGSIWFLAHTMPTDVRLDWLESGHHFIISKDEAFFLELERVKEDVEDSEISHTGILVDFDSVGEVSIGLSGIALPSVPLVDLVDGYSVDLLADGTWGYDSKSAILQLKVEFQKISLVPLQPGILLNSIGVVPGQSVDISKGGMLRYRDWNFRILCNIGGLYRALIIGSSTREVLFNIGDQIEIGRQPVGARFTLVDRGGSNRIQWSTSIKASQARKQRLTLDRALTGRRHSHLNIISKDLFVASSIHLRLPTFIIRRNGRRLERIKNEKKIEIGDMLVVGTYIISLTNTF